ncbi:MAG: UDP-N-acetylmuramate dehydrogenase [Elusimicrobiota bacterium]|nr:UDP-N-acetylmuramate dehydrogenase [Endomicrobiia bacterium]MCX7910493.1 UDP-N-acetylmuramate dehydrogenase [Endomicrobiia bacterium]MDW8166007.1 UDP-N-acetylmuramate dehydrogenase [Elusimicrobiota bacterium]
MVKDFLSLIKPHGIDVRQNEILKKYTTLNIGGAAKFFVNVNNLLQLKTVLKIANECREEILVIGAGSNMLISDNGFDGVVIKLRGEFSNFYIMDNNVVSYSGVMLPFLIKTTVDYSLGGLEELFGIPGSIGGAIMMNAGTKTSTISDNLDYIEVIEITNPDKVIKLTKNEINFGYRKSGLEGFIIVKAAFILRKSDKDILKKRITEILIERNKTQPLGTFNVGCVFKNPQDGKISSAKLIESCGLKGFFCGDAYVSEKHANFIINRQNATSEDFVKVIRHVIKTVKEKYNIELEPEIKLINIQL